MGLFSKVTVHGEGDQPAVNRNTISREQIKDLRRRAGSSQVRGTPLSPVPSIWHRDAEKGRTN